MTTLKVGIPNRIPHQLPFTSEELLTLLEAAKIALSDADMFREVVDEMDLSVKELARIEVKLNAWLNEESPCDKNNG